MSARVDWRCCESHWLRADTGTKLAGIRVAGWGGGGEWPSQVFTLTDELLENVGQPRQVSGEQTPQDTTLPPLSLAHQITSVRTCPTEE